MKLSNLDPRLDFISEVQCELLAVSGVQSLAGVQLYTIHIVDDYPLYFVVTLMPCDESTYGVT